MGLQRRPGRLAHRRDRLVRLARRCHRGALRPLAGDERLRRGARRPVRAGPPDGGARRLPDAGDGRAGGGDACRGLARAGAGHRRGHGQRVHRLRAGGDGDDPAAGPRARPRVGQRAAQHRRQRLRGRRTRSRRPGAAGRGPLARRRLQRAHLRGLGPARRARARPEPPRRRHRRRRGRTAAPADGRGPDHRGVLGHRGAGRLQRRRHLRLRHRHRAVRGGVGGGARHRRSRATATCWPASASAASRPPDWSPGWSSSPASDR